MYSATSFLFLLLVLPWILKLYRFLSHFLATLSLYRACVSFLWVANFGLFLFALEFRLYFVTDGVKQLIDVGAIFGTGLEKYTISEFSCNTFTLLITNDSLGLEIGFISGQGDYYVRRCVVINVFDPFGETGKGFTVCDRINLHI